VAFKRKGIVNCGLILLFSAICKYSQVANNVMTKNNILKKIGFRKSEETISVTKTIPVKVRVISFFIDY
jgi:hypothetical protein